LNYCNILTECRQLSENPTAYDAYVLSWISMFFTVLAFGLGVGISVASHSAATLGYALENGVDSFSSALVLWRFWGGGKEGGPTEAQLELREKRASIGIGMMFIILAVVVGGVASAHLDASEPPEEPGLLLGLSAPSVLIFLVLGVLKYRVGKKIDSPSLAKDGVCSLCGSGLSFGVCLGAAFIEQENYAVWWLDATIAVTVSIGLYFYGLYTLIKNAQAGNLWWRLEFWYTPKSRRTPMAEKEELDKAGIDMTPNKV